MRTRPGVFASLFLLTFQLQAQSIGNCSPKIIAGPATTGAGDGGPATQAQLNNPVSFARDASGNLYVADLNNYRVRMITPDGVIHAFAGKGTRAYSGDGGPATAASFISPAGLAISPAGEVYISDNAAHVVRKVAQDGTIQTVAGNGFGGFAGDGGPATSAMLSEPGGISFDGAGNLYVADSNNNRIRRVDTHGIITTIAGGGPNAPSDGARATSATLFTPQTVAADANGNVYFDTEEAFLFEVTTDGLLHLLAGASTQTQAAEGSRAVSSGFIELRDPAFTAGAALLFASQAQNGTAVWQLLADGTLHQLASGAYGFGLIANPDGSVTHGTFGGQAYSYAPGASSGTLVAGAGPGMSGDGGPATAAMFESLSGVTTDSSGSVYVSDGEAGVIRRISANGTIVRFGGNQSSTATPDGVSALNTSINWPGSLAMGADGSLYYAEVNAHRVRRIGTDGDVTTVAGNGDYATPYMNVGDQRNGAVATQAAISGASIALDGAGNLYIADVQSNVVWEVTGDGKLHMIFNANGAPEMAVSSDGAGGVYFAVSTPNQTHALYRMAPGAPQAVANLSAWIPTIWPFAMDAQGNYYSGGLDSEAVTKMAPGGSFSWLTQTPLEGAQDTYQSALPLFLRNPLAIDAGGNLYALDTEGLRVVEIPNATTCTASVFPVAAGTGPLNAANYGWQGFVAPGELITIFGQQTGPANLAGPTIANGAFANETGNTQILFNNIPAPVVFASAGQSSAMVPFELAGEYTARMQVVVNGMASPAVLAHVGATAPGIFSQDSSGTGLGAILNTDYSLNGPSHPAPKGSTVMVYATGFGIISPAAADGALTTAPYPSLVAAFSAEVNGENAVVSYAGTAPSLIDGAVQFNVQIPMDAASGVATLSIFPAGTEPSYLGASTEVQIQ